MSNHDDLEILAAWEVGTTELSARVQSAIGAPAPVTELLTELRAFRHELSELRNSQALLQEEMGRLRHELAGRTATRITPYAPTEGLIRLA